eukprot:scaffold138215_cov139-Phaeocystis_antarctica.AAC.1
MRPLGLRAVVAVAPHWCRPFPRAGLLGRALHGQRLAVPRRADGDALPPFSLLGLLALGAGGSLLLLLGGIGLGGAIHLHVSVLLLLGALGRRLRTGKSKSMLRSAAANSDPPHI